MTILPMMTIVIPPMMTIVIHRNDLFVLAKNKKHYQITRKQFSKVFFEIYPWSYRG